jgi:hypothetical protein
MAARRRRAAMVAYAANNKLDYLGSWLPRYFKAHALSDWGSSDEAENVVLGNRNDYKVLIFDQYHKAGRRSSRRTIVGVELKAAAGRNVSEAVSWNGAERVGEWLVWATPDKLLDVNHFDEELSSHIRALEGKWGNRGV